MIKLENALISRFDKNANFPKVRVIFKVFTST